MNKLLFKETVKRVEKALRKFDTNLKIISLDETARTAKDAASSLKCELGAIVKSLVFKAEGEFLVCLVSGDKRCSLNRLKKILNQKDVAMANANEVKDHTGFSIGGVAPTGRRARRRWYACGTLQQGRVRRCCADTAVACARSTSALTAVLLPLSASTATSTR